MSVTCVSLRCAPSKGRQSKSKSLTRTTCTNRTMENETETKRKIRRLTRENDHDKENMCKPLIQDNKYVFPGRLPSDAANKLSWSVRRFIRPTKEENTDQSPVHVKCLPRNFLTPKVSGLSKRNSCGPRLVTGHDNKAYVTPTYSDKALQHTSDGDRSWPPVPARTSKRRRTESALERQKCMRRRPNMTPVRHPEPVCDVLPNTVTLRSGRQATQGIIGREQLLTRSEPDGEMSPEQAERRTSKCQSTTLGITSHPFKPPKPRESTSELCTSKTLKDLSVISQQSGAEVHEQASSANLSGAFHSTLNYPLHSTLNYPLHSTFSEQDDFIPKPAGKSSHVARRKYISDTIMEDTEGESSYLSDDLSIDVDEYAANWEAVKMKRQKGQAALSGNRVMPNCGHDVDDLAKSSCPRETSTTGHRQHVSYDEDDSSNDSTLTHVTYASLHDVWNSPNNTLKNTKECLPQLDTPNNTYASDAQPMSHSCHRTKAIHIQPETPRIITDTTSSSYGIKTSLYIQETPRWHTPRMLKRTHHRDLSKEQHNGSNIHRSRKSRCANTPNQHNLLTPENDSTDSGLSTCDSPPQSKQLKICDNTGRCRSIILDGSGHKHSITAEHKKVVTDRLRSFSSSCASHSVLLML